MKKETEPTIHDKDCQLGDNSADCPACQENWLQDRERSPTFQAWMESLNEKKVKRAGGEGYSTAKFERNWSTSRR